MNTLDKLPAKQAWCLNEAIRRYNLFHKGDNPLKAWTGLGYKTDYKPVVDAGLMEFDGDYYPRCIGWLVLTQKGLDIVKPLLNLRG